MIPYLFNVRILIWFIFCTQDVGSRDEALSELREEIYSLSSALADVQSQFSLSEEQVFFISVRARTLFYQSILITFIGHCLKGHD